MIQIFYLSSSHTSQVKIEPAIEEDTRVKCELPTSDHKTETYSLFKPKKEKSKRGGGSKRNGEDSDEKSNLLFSSFSKANSSQSEASLIRSMQIKNKPPTCIKPLGLNNDSNMFSPGPRSSSTQIESTGSSKKRSRKTETGNNPKPIATPEDLRKFEFNKSNRSFKKQSQNPSNEWICINDTNEHQNYILIDGNERSERPLEREKFIELSDSSFDFGQDEDEMDFAAFRANKKKNLNQTDGGGGSVEMARSGHHHHRNESSSASVELAEILDLNKSEHDFVRCFHCAGTLIADLALSCDRVERKFKRDVPEHIREYQKRNNCKKLLVLSSDQAESLSLRPFSVTDERKLVQNCFFDQATSQFWQHFECTHCSSLAGVKLVFSSQTSSEFFSKYHNRMLIFFA